jgi:hypothetical protein
VLAGEEAERWLRGDPPARKTMFPALTLDEKTAQKGLDILVRCL